MTLSDFATFSTAISGLAVTASLIYLALQTHQNSKHTRALIRQGRASRMIAAFVGFSDTDKCAAWLEVNGMSSTPANIRRRQVMLYNAGLVTGMEDVFSQHAEGLLDDDHFHAQCASARAAFREPAFKTFWQTYKSERPSAALKFQQFMDDLASTATQPMAQMTPN